MKTFKEFQFICEAIKKYKTPEQIADKHGVGLSFINNQLKKGIKVEYEHTNNEKLATVIALQHLDEIPDYYTKLKKLEASSKNKKIDEGTLHHWFKGSKSKDGKPGWVQADGSPCANEPDETETPKCFSSGRLAALKKKGKTGKKLIASAVKRKRLHDKEQQLKSDAARPTYVRTFAKGKKDPNYIKAEPKIKEDLDIVEATKDKPREGSGTKDACYYKVKARYKVWPSAYACVPEEGTKALTRNGWKTVNELALGEEIMTYNLQKDELEFKPILNLHRYKNANTVVVRNGNTRFVFESTTNHNWVAANINTNIPNNIETNQSKYLIDTQSLIDKTDNGHIIVSATYKNKERLKENLAYKDIKNWIKYILNISEDQRQSWIFSSLFYNNIQHNNPITSEKLELANNSTCKCSSNKQNFSFILKDVNQRDAVLTSAFLNGGSVNWSINKLTNSYICQYTNNKQIENSSNLKVIQEKTADVWCPETENGTWVMYQEIENNGIITITGNSGALVKCRKKGADNWGKSSSDVKEEYVRIQKNGNTFTILLTWRGMPKKIQMFFSNMKYPTKQEVEFEINKVYPGALVLSFKPDKLDPTKPYLFTGEK